MLPTPNFGFCAFAHAFKKGGEGDISFIGTLPNHFDSIFDLLVFQKRSHQRRKVLLTKNHLCLPLVDLSIISFRPLLRLQMPTLRSEHAHLSRLTGSANHFRWSVFELQPNCFTSFKHSFSFLISVSPFVFLRDDLKNTQPSLNCPGMQILCTLKWRVFFSEFVFHFDYLTFLALPSL